MLSFLNYVVLIALQDFDNDLYNNIGERRFLSHKYKTYLLIKAVQKRLAM